MWILARLCVSLMTIALVAGTGCQGSDRTNQVAAPSAAPTRVASPYPLVVAAVGDPLSFNPIISDTEAGRAFGGAVFDTLLRLDPATATVRPGLAAKWTYDPENTEYTLSLRKDVVWHDGKPLSARDVVFTVEAIHATSDSPYSGILRVDDQAVEVAEIDATTVRFFLPRPYAPFLKSLVIPIMPAHKFETYRESDRLGEIAGLWGVGTSGDEIVGTGPFRLASYHPGQRIVLERNPVYWRTDPDGERMPYLDRYILRIAPNRQTAMEWFLGGAVHIFSPRFDEVATLRNAPTANEFVIEEIGTDTSSLFLTFNRNPLHYRQRGESDPRFSWFNDPRFLQGIAHAIDKRAIIDGALGGYGVPARSLIPPANPFSDNELGGYPFDLALARSMLDEAGYRDRDRNGVREDANRKPIEFSLATNQGNTIRERIAKLLVAQLAEVGVRVTLQTLPFPDLFERIDATYDWDALLIGFTVGIDPASSENLLRSNGELHVWHPLQQTPATAWEAQIDDLLDEGTRELDPTRRWEIYREVQAILHKQLPMIQLVRPTLFAARRNQVENFRPSPWGFHRIEELRLRKPVSEPRSDTPAS